MMTTIESLAFGFAAAFIMETIYFGILYFLIEGVPWRRNLPKS